MSIAPNVRRNLFEATTDQTTDHQTHDNKVNESDSSYQSLLENENAELIAEIEKAETSLAEAIALLPDRIETICAKYKEMIETRLETVRQAKRLELDEAIKRLKNWHETEMCKLKTVKSNHIRYLLFSGDTNLETEYLEIINGLKDL